MQEMQKLAKHVLCCFMSGVMFPKNKAKGRVFSNLDKAVFRITKIPMKK